MNVRRLFDLGLIILAVAAIVLGARVDVPMTPVPMTLQSLAVLLAGGLLGPWRGMAAVVAYLALAALGAPVLAEGASGVGRLIGPTGGYLAAFVPAALLAGAAAQRGWLKRWGPATGVFLAGHGLILGLGCGWLALGIGWGAAWAGGVQPFLIGAGVKSALGALIVRIAAGRPVP